MSTKYINKNNILIPKIITHSQSQNNFADNDAQKHPPKMTHSCTFDNIIKKETNWSEDIRKYNENKKILPWGYNPQPKIIKEKYIKALDIYFNPITQKYRDTKFDNELKKQEEAEMKDKISLFYDNELRVMQTYDIINLQDRLRGFENHPDYPKYKGSASNLKKIGHLSTKENYNIISNINLSQHHYSKPEDRPIYKIVKNNIKKINLKKYKDYNIISNKYNLFDKEKKEVENEIQKLEAAEKFCKSRDYDIIKGSYIDINKEKKYQEDMKNRIEILKHSKRDSIFNPFNNEIFDKEKYDLENKKLQNKVLRYSIKSDIESFHRQQDLNKYIQKNNSSKSKLMYQRFKYNDKRGYDFITGKDNYDHYKNSLECKNIQRPWEIIKNGVNDNETLSNKKLYLCYDKDDNDKRFNECKISRENMLKSLPKIEDESTFKIKQYKHQINLESYKNNNNNRYQCQGGNNSFNIDKKTWFSQEKNNNYFKNG